MLSSASSEHFMNHVSYGSWRADSLGAAVSAAQAAITSNNIDPCSCSPRDVLGGPLAHLDTFLVSCLSFPVLFLGPFPIILASISSILAPARAQNTPSEEKSWLNLLFFGTRSRTTEED